MLVLTRKIGEVIVCKLPGGRTMEVKVKDARPGRVRLAFDAPKDVVILREEIDEARTAGYELAVDDAARRVIDQTPFQDEYADR